MRIFGKTDNLAEKIRFVPTSTGHRVPTFRVPPKHLDLIYFCNILVISVMHLHILLKFSLEIAKFSALRTNYFLFLQLFQTFLSMLSQIILFLKLLE